MAFDPVPLQHEFTGAIGVEVKGEVWACVDVPGSAELFGTRRTVRVDAVVDGLSLPNTGLLVTGGGGHMLSLNKALRAKLGKDVGDSVTVRLERRLS